MGRLNKEMTIIGAHGRDDNKTDSGSVFWLCVRVKITVFPLYH